MSTARKILENTAVQFGGKIATAILSIFVIKMISGYLNAAGYGQYTAAYNFLAFFGIAADFGIYTITVKEMSKDHTKIPEILGNVLGLRTLLIIITMSLAAIAVFFLPEYQDTMVPIGVVIGTLATLFTLLNGTISTVLQVHLKMQYTTIGLVIGKIASVGYIALVVYYLFPTDKATGFEHLIWSGVLANLIMFLITFYYVSRYTKIRYRFDFPFWKKIFWTSLPYGVALVLSGIYFRLDTILLYKLLPHADKLADGSYACQQTLCSDTEAGLYGIGLRFLEMLVIIPVYFMNAVIPTMTRFLEEGKEKVVRVVQYSLDFLLAIALPIMVGGFILAAPIIHFISSEDYVSGTKFAFGADVAIQFLVFAMFFSFINVIFAFTLVVLNKQKKLIYINAGCVVLNIIGNYLVIPDWGFRGAALTTILCEIFIMIFTARAVKKDLGLHLNYKAGFKILLSSLTMGIFIWFLYNMMSNLWFVWQLALLVPLGALIYGLMLLATKTISPEMREVLRRK